MLDLLKNVCLAGPKNGDFVVPQNSGCINDPKLIAPIGTLLINLLKYSVLAEIFGSSLGISFTKNFFFGEK